MSGPRRAFVQRASTYRYIDRDPLCGFCGEPITPNDLADEVSDPAFAGVPMLVHRDCANTQEPPVSAEGS